MVKFKVPPPCLSLPIFYRLPIRKTPSTPPIFQALHYGSGAFSAGIDGALHLVARLCDLQSAKQTAKYMEYKWEPEAANAVGGK